MTAFLFTLALFAAWWGIGLAMIVAAGLSTGDLRLALSAPALGSAATVLPLFVLSESGVPMDDCGLPVGIALVVASIGVLSVRRPRLSAAMLPPAVVCVINLVLIGRPMLHFGFGWLANANADMANYVLSATQLMNHGLLGPFDFSALAQNRDYATAIQGLHAAGARPGANITLAGLAALTGLSPTALYMPMCLALNLCMVCGTGALAMQAAKRWWAASLGALLVAVSPLAAYGVLQQLMPQTWGLALAVGLFALLLRPHVHEARGGSIGELVLIATLAVAFVVVYIELAASLIAAYLLYAVILGIQHRVSVRAVLRLWGTVTCAALALVNSYLFRELHFVTGSAGSGLKGSVGIRLFGYALVPSALPGIFGFQLLYAAPSASHMGVLIVLAALLAVVIAVASFLSIHKGVAASVVLVSDVALAGALAVKGSDFGLFKLYMYMQPFIAAALAVWVSSVLRSRVTMVIAAVLLSAIVVLQLHTQSLYVGRSRNPVDLRHASENDLLPAFRLLMATSGVPVVAVTDNVTLGVLEAAAAGRRPLYFVSRNFFGEPWRRPSYHAPAGEDPWLRREFDLHPRRGRAVDMFDQNVDAARILSRGSCVIALPTGSQMALNRRAMPEGSPDIEGRPCRAVRNVLAFVVSVRGQSFSIPDNRNEVGIWQLESDAARPGRTLSGFGHYALFELLNPSPRVRIALDFSGVNSRDSGRLPPASVVGATRSFLPVVGSGSARVFSAPLRPQWIGGRAYVLLDMGAAGDFPTVTRPGIAGLWGRSVPLDPRRLTSYVRDVSAVTAAEFSALRAPSELRDVPAALADPSFRFSGIYDDGWLSRDAYAVMAGGPAGRLTVVTRAVSPGQRLTVIVDGRAAWSGGVAPGTLHLGVSIPASATPRTVRLRWALTTRISSADSRQAAARLLSLGIGRARAPTSLSLPSGLSDPRLDYDGIYMDGWLRRESHVLLAGGPAGFLAVHATVAVERQRLDVFVGPRRVASYGLESGPVALRVRIPASPRPRDVVLRWREVAPISTSDPRRAAALLTFIGVSKR